MTQKPQIEVRAILSLALVGTSITVTSLEDALQQLKRQASITGVPQKLLIADDEPSMLQVGVTTAETVFTEPDATLSISAWSLLVDGATKITLPKAEPLIARAKALAAHQNVGHILLTSVRGARRIELTETAITPDIELSATTQVEDTPSVVLQEPQIEVASTPDIASAEALPEKIASAPMTQIETVSREEPVVSPSNEFIEEPSEPFLEGLDRTDQDSADLHAPARSLPRRALLVGLSAAAVLGVGSFAAFKLFGTNQPSPSVSPPAVLPQPALEPPFPGVEPEAIQEFPMAYSDLAISTDGQFLAVQISDSEVSIQKTTANGETPTPGIKDGEILTFEGKLAPPVLPLGAPHGDGFILRILNSSGDLGASSKLIVWTPNKGAITHDLPIGSQLTSRGGHSWISSTIPSTGPRTVQAITATKLEKYVAPSYGPALFGLLPKSTALWARIETDNNASILTSNAQGKISATGILKRPAKSAVVAKWIAATADHALMLWKNTDGYVLALHKTKSGEITNKADFKLPEGTTADRLQSRSTTNGTVVILGNVWADLKTGKFGAPDGIDLKKFEGRPRPGGIELRTDTESKFRPDSGSIFSVPNQGTVLAVTKEVVIVEESRLVSVYRKTTTEGK